MKRGDLLRYLMNKGCILLREGSKHSVWVNPATGRQATVGRHQELDNLLCRRICQQLGVEPPGRG